MAAITNATNLATINSAPLFSETTNAKEFNRNNRVSDTALIALQNSMKLTLVLKTQETLCKQLTESNAETKKLSIEIKELRAKIEQQNNNNKPCTIPSPPALPIFSSLKNSSKNPVEEQKPKNPQKNLTNPNNLENPTIDKIQEGLKNLKPLDPNLILKEPTKSDHKPPLPKQSPLCRAKPVCISKTSQDNKNPKSVVTQETELKKGMSVANRIQQFQNSNKNP